MDSHGPRGGSLKRTTSDDGARLLGRAVSVGHYPTHQIPPEFIPVSGRALICNLRMLNRHLWELRGEVSMVAEQLATERADAARVKGR